MADADKVSRRQRKAALSREINKLNKLIAEEDQAGVSGSRGKLHDLFANFEHAHEKYHGALEEDEDIDESDDYFLEVQSNYISTLQSSKQWLASMAHQPDSSNKGIKTTYGDDEPGDAAAFIGLLNLPKVELEPFDGNPLHYHSFMAVFDDSVDSVIKDHKKKLTRLLQYTTGKAKDAIRNCVLSKDDGYLKARSILEKRFGSEHLVVDRTVANLKRGKQLRTAEELQKFADELNCSYLTLEEMKSLHEVEGQSSIAEIADRLPPFHRNRWKKHALDVKDDTNSYPNFKGFVDFVMKQSERENDPVYGHSFSKSKQQTVKPKNSASSFTSEVKFSASIASKPPCVACNGNHRLWYCSEFKGMKPVDRLELVTKNKLCENCLLSNHVVSDCRRQTVCSVPGCGQKHTKFIHVTPSTVNQVSNDTGTASQNRVSNASANIGGQVHMPLVPVKVNGVYDTFALLDTASSNSFCSKQLVEALGLQGRRIEYELSTLSNSSEKKYSTVVDFDLVSSSGRESMFVSSAYVVDEIPIQTPLPSVCDYLHLQGLPLHVPQGDQKAQVLIGQDHSEALIPLDVRRGNQGEPFAVRTLFGWTLNGPTCASRVGNKVVSHFIHTQSLEEKVDRLWAVENEGLQEGELSWSQEDKHVISLWEEKVRFVDGHYELPIPWKSDVVVPDNKVVALSRLKSLKLSLDKRGLMDRYNSEVQKLLDVGHAEVVDTSSGSIQDSQQKIWYLPHHAVISEKKPDKLRIVFDCASRFQGQSLNDKCLQGPDLNNRLNSVLVRFRQYPYAISSDIEAMYYQVVIPSEDRDALRFLWFAPSGEVVTYRMTRHVFGGVWCASSSAFALQHTLVDNPGVDPLVCDTVKNSFYVDDCLCSVQTKQEAATVITGTSELLRKCGFRLTKFVVSDRELVELVPESDRAKEVKDLDLDACSKVLGIRWHVGSDELYFVVESKQRSHVTRRYMLSTICSTYDPLGLVSPVLVVGKILFQDATRHKLSWDESVCPEIQESFNTWLHTLVDLDNVRISRCVLPQEFSDAVVELHHFSDSSERSYGCCSYLRAINHQGRIHTSLLCSKVKVAPIKVLTIPRLELMAAVLSAQMDLFLRKELTLSLTSSYFWVDSDIVLKYVKNDTHRLQVFVANRVSLIRSLSQPSQWYHIPGQNNPADVVTRGQTPAQLQSGNWWHGPDFLRSYKSEWQLSEPNIPLSSEDPEVKGSGRKVVSCFAVATDDSPTDRLLSYYSSWWKLKVAVAWILRLKVMLREKSKVGKGPELQLEDLRGAETAVLQYVQGQVYNDEIDELSSGKPISGSSSLASLSPVLSKDGLLHVGGRLVKSSFPESVKQPVIVPHRHHVAVLIAESYHNVAHLGIEWIVSQIRRKFWITSVRRVLRQISNKCIKCKRLFASSCSQRMADLPAERLEPGHPPFWNVGIDCFGPYYVKQGRAEVKRYGCIFTCFTTRAIHLEKLNTLETDSFLNAFRRFSCRRGVPQKVWSDNGTNFVGGKAELDRSMKCLDQDLVKKYGIEHGISWSFNPPGASHMGGIWERMIRTVRKVMLGIFDTTVRMSDEVLETLFCEIESIVNSRPITKVSNDISDPGALTPNHLLLLRECPSAPPGVFSEGNVYQRRWRCVQSLAEQFWRRWLKEYVPELQKRHKWTRTQRNIQKGDLVLVVGENTPRGLWPMGLVVESSVSSDGLVRSVKIKTKSTEIVRPVTKVVLLEGVEP